MDITQLTQRALQIRQQYSELELKQNGAEWTNLNLAEGFMVDAGELMKLVMAKEGLRQVDDVDAKLAHELSDCLWSVLVLAKKYNINLEEQFMKTMAELEAKIAKESQ